MAKLRPPRDIPRCGSTESAGLRRRPNSVQALKDVNLEIWPGEFVVLWVIRLRKDDTLNLVGGIEEPTAGRILMAGEDIGTLNAKQRTAYRRDRVGFVFQFFNLVPR